MKSTPYQFRTRRGFAGRRPRACLSSAETDELSRNDIVTTVSKRMFRRLRLHVVLTFLLVELALFLSRRVLVLLVLRDKVVHVALRFSELHLVHSLTRVPVQEGLAAE